MRVGATMLRPGNPVRPGRRFDPSENRTRSTTSDLASAVNKPTFVSTAGEETDHVWCKVEPCDHEGAECGRVDLDDWFVRGWHRHG